MAIKNENKDKGTFTNKIPTLKNLCNKIKACSILLITFFSIVLASLIFLGSYSVVTCIYTTKEELINDEFIFNLLNAFNSTSVDTIKDTILNYNTSIDVFIDELLFPMIMLSIVCILIILIFVKICRIIRPIKTNAKLFTKENLKHILELKKPLIIALIISIFTMFMSSLFWFLASLYLFFEIFIYMFNYIVNKME